MKLQLPTILTFTTLPPQAKTYDSGFYIRLGCMHAECKEDPVLHIKSNSKAGGSCRKHIADCVFDMLQQDTHDDSGHGFLYRPQRRTGPLFPDGRPLHADMAHIIWDGTLDDGAATAHVYGSARESWGVLVVRAGDHELTREPVYLSYGAPFGPDAGDVQAWVDRALELIDEHKPLRQQFNEALQRMSDKQHHLEALLKTSLLTCAAFKKALDVFGNANAAVDFLLSPTNALDGKAPAELLSDDAALKRVTEYLHAITSSWYPLSYPKEQSQHGPSAAPRGGLDGPV
ncbi:MAG: DUF2384 domain-containing protein [Candidatus Eremiobacteraeota bacterium]|nr:DUF2384 domain-containing protein [Candidatus Eremiobacteraeota bacterium]MBV9972276.1 DUF2384 domain-containing protein [Candidatus Eremiobacteraeota bacterium]